jgi:hypothetical protein
MLGVARYTVNSSADFELGKKTKFGNIKMIQTINVSSPAIIKGRRMIGYVQLKANWEI